MVMQDYGDRMSIVTDVLSGCVLNSGWIHQHPDGSFSVFRMKYTASK